jgi:hypothetical protein
MKLFNEEKMEKFNNTWSRYDPDATGFIPIYQIHKLLTDLGSPMGFSESHNKDSKAQRDRFIANLELPTYNGFKDYAYHDILFKLSLRLTVIE